MNMLMLLFLNGADFSPCVQIFCGQHQWSGAVVREDPQFYYVVTCNHWSDKTHSRLLRVGLVSGARSTEVLAKVIRQSPVLDLSCLRIAKRPQMRISPLRIADIPMVRGDFCKVHGFIRSSRTPIWNSLTFHSNSYLHSEDGSMLLLSCKGHGVYGMSGGALVREGVVHGVQLYNTVDPLSDTPLTAFVPAAKIQEFLSGL